MEAPMGLGPLVGVARAAVLIPVGILLWARLQAGIPLGTLARARSQEKAN
eukprot:m.264403 g.264403  ORF g.264403 m.264403 type:complete len:50 (+) comp54661_c0_seq4:217-366(+)